MTSILYLTRNGLLEPLGQSQVMAYLRGLSHHYQITLITYEKPEDWAVDAAVARARSDCDAHGIRWLPQRFRSRPKLIAPALSMLRMVWLVHREVQRGRIRLIHARSYIPAAVAYVVSRLTGVPFIFDMRALWPEELITAGRLRRGSLIHRAIVAAERACLQRAAAVVSLTHAAVEYLRQEYPDELCNQRIDVIPTCVDLERFVPADNAPEAKLIGCLGTVLSGWFKADWLATFIATAAARDPELRFEITTRDDPARVRAAIGGNLEVQDRLHVAPSPSEHVHEVIQGQTASVMFYAGGEVSELGRSPTRMGEILGCGLPVVANDGVGDVAGIIQEHRVGILVKGPEPEHMATALSELDQLLLDPDLSARCRAAAGAVFSLKCGTEAYASLYADILDPPGKPSYVRIERC